MKHVSREMGQKLSDAGWVRETEFVYVLRPVKEYVAQNAESGFQWVLWTTAQSKAFYGDLTVRKDWLPAPTLDEILEDLSHADFLKTWCRLWTAPGEFGEWLYAAMRDPDAAAEVWLKTKGESK